MSHRAPKEELNKRSVFIGLLGVILIGGIVFLGNVASRSTMPPASKDSLPKTFAKFPIKAKAAFVYDAKTKQTLYSMNGNSQLPLASLTKIMMAVTALELLHPDTVVTIGTESLQRGEGDSGLYGRERWRLSDLLGLTLVESANAGANAIAQAAGGAAAAQIAAAAGGVSASADNYETTQAQFVAAMDQKAAALGLHQMYFLNPSGLDENNNVSGGYGSAHDVSLLFSYAITKYPRIFENTTYGTRRFTSLSNLTHIIKNTDIFVGNFPGLLAGKTGYTDLAGGNLTIAFDAGPDHPIIVTVLGSTEQGRFTDAEKLVWATLDYLQS
ncbi:serine hydrolase [Patescibacteria group bacterium]|nr:serine hydrolase [Patescibacteria group bacterium]